MLEFMALFLHLRTIEQRRSNSFLKFLRDGEEHMYWMTRQSSNSLVVGTGILLSFESKRKKGVIFRSSNTLNRMVEKATLPEGIKYFYQLSGFDGKTLGTDVNMSAQATLSYHSED